MRSRLFWKLFVLQMLAAATLIGGALAVTRMHSLRNFAAFVEKHDREQVRELADELAEAYARSGDLAEAARSIPPLWRRLQPPLRHPPEETDEHDELEALEPPPPGEHREHMRVVRLHRPLLPLQLQDAAGQRVLGIPETLALDSEREPVTVEGKIVGYLARPPLHHPPEQLEFEHEQLRHLQRVVIVALLVAAAFAALITGIIVRPLRDLSRGAGALARREFGTRLPEGRRDELGALASDFNRLAAALEGYDTRQRQWLADVSHELRTPVSVLRGELEALLDGVRKADEGALRSLRQEVQRLEALIDDLRLVSLAESGALRLNLAETDLGALARQSAERFRERLKARGFALDVGAVNEGAANVGAADVGAADVGAANVGAALAATVDPQRIDQVLANLLENVLRHATPPGPVSVTVRREGDFAVIAVSDSGPGVPADALPRLFDRLYRVESSRTRGTGGAGLGLAICRSIVEAHGGTIEARASGLGGLEIVARLPVVGAAHGRDR
jgi:two-component system, OmpR family, sensor histidine kinase BaeS